MRTMNLWTVAASLFCTLALSDAAYQAQHQARLAAVGNPAAVSALSDAVARMGGSSSGLAAAPAAHPTAVSFSPSDASGLSSDIASLKRWTQEKGRQNTLDGNGSRLLGLSQGAALPVVRKAFEDDDTKVVYVFNLVSVDGGVKIVMYRFTPELSTMWLIAEDGRILRAAESTRTTLAVVPNDRYYSYFLETKDYLLNEMGKQMGVASKGSGAPGKS